MLATAATWIGLAAVSLVSAAASAAPTSSSASDIERMAADAAAQRSLAIETNRVNLPAWPFLLGQDVGRQRAVEPKCSYVAGFLLRDRIQQWGWLHIAVCKPGELGGNVIADAQTLQRNAIARYYQLQPESLFAPIAFPPRHAIVDAATVVDYWSVVTVDQYIGVAPTLVLEREGRHVVVQLWDARIRRCIFNYDPALCEDLYSWMLGVALKADELRERNRQPAVPAMLGYSARAFAGTVVDADTAVPLADAIVVASWELESRGGRRVGVLYSTESVTDAHGRFSMPAWGPIGVNVQASGEHLPARMDPDEPLLFVFKQGYEPKAQLLGNAGTSYLNDPWWTGERVRSVASEPTLQLRKSQASPADYSRTLEGWRLRTAFMNGCGWTRSPRMAVALIREGQRLKRLTGRNDIFDPMWLSETFRGTYCGSTKPILDEALN